MTLIVIMVEPLCAMAYVTENVIVNGRRIRRSTCVYDNVYDCVSGAIAVEIATEIRGTALAGAGKETRCLADIVSTPGAMGKGNARGERESRRRRRH